MKGKNKQMGDFIHCYSCYCIVTANEDQRKQKFVSIICTT